MSCRSTIALKEDNGSYKSIYCHNDSYLEHNGVLLHFHYADPTKVKLLMSLGDISKLEEHVFPDVTKEHNFDKPQDFVTIAYHRDRDEDLNFQVFNSKESLLNYFSKSNEDYLYLFEDNNWYVVDKENNLELKPLSEELLKENLIDFVAHPYSYEDELSCELVNYAKDFDTYDYNDVYSNDDDAFNDMKKNLQTTSGIDTMIEWLCSDIHYFASEKDLSDKEMNKLSKQAFNLITKLNIYSKVLEQEKDKEMDDI